VQKGQEAVYHCIQRVLEAAGLEQMYICGIYIYIHIYMHFFPKRLTSKYIKTSKQTHMSRYHTEEEKVESIRQYIKKVIPVTLEEKLSKGND
jgi:hypothetical protein